MEIDKFLKNQEVRNCRLVLNGAIRRGMQDALFWSLLIGWKRVVHTLEQSPL